MRFSLCLMLALAGCTDGQLAVADLNAFSVVGRLEGLPHGSAELRFQGPSDRDCVTDVHGISATLDGVPTRLVAGADRADEGDTMGCKSVFLDTGVVPTPDAPLDVVFHDSTGDAHIVIPSPFIRRGVAVDGGALVAGTTAVLRWQTATDTFTASPIRVECFSQNSLGGYQLLFVAATDPNDPHPGALPLGVTGTTLSFATPALAYHGAVTCTVEAEIVPAFATCDGFASCDARYIPHGGPWPNPAILSAVPFTTSI